MDDYKLERTMFEQRMTQVYVPGKEMSLAHVIGAPKPIIYEKLSLEPDWDNLGQWAIGIMKFTPWESSFVAADVALDTSAVQLGFVDRFVGCLIITGYKQNVQTAVEGVRTYFRDTLDFSVCELTKS